MQTASIITLYRALGNMMQKHQQSKEVQEAYEARGEEYVALGVHATLFDIETLTTLNVLLPDDDDNATRNNTHLILRTYV